MSDTTPTRLPPLGFHQPDDNFFLTSTLNGQTDHLLLRQINTLLQQLCQATYTGPSVGATFSLQRALIGFKVVGLHYAVQPDASVQLTLTVSIN